MRTVDKILSDLEVNNIPQLIVLNKADLVDEVTLQSLERTLLIDKGSRSVSVSAIQAQTLKSLLDDIGEVLAKDLHHSAAHIV